MGEQMKRIKAIHIILLASFLSLSACASNEETGTILGAIVGVAVGSLIGDGEGQAAAMALGGAIGAMAGNAIGRSLDEAERLKAEKATQLALEEPTGNKITWESDDDADISGYTQPVNEPRKIGEKVCRSVKEVVIIGGQEGVDNKLYCWTGSSWVLS